MKGQEVLFSGAHSSPARERGSTDNWGTPQKFFDLLHQEFGFTLDPCADETNAKAVYFDEVDNGLAQPWEDNVCFVNFPYSQAKAWAAKCVDAQSKGATVVVLCAARTDTGWWQWLAQHASEVRFVRGRLAFVGPSNTGQSATFPSCVIVLKPGAPVTTKTMKLWDLPAGVRR